MIPHTVGATTFKFVKTGDVVNLEVDVIGKYVEKMTKPDAGERQPRSEITEEFLRQNGFS